MSFERYIGIDFSGADTPEKGLSGIRVYETRSAAVEPAAVDSTQGAGRRWSRNALFEYLLQTLHHDHRAIVGMDFGFSFPIEYFQKYQIKSWPAFLKDFCKHWPTETGGVTVSSLRKANPRMGDPAWLRLTERWTASAMSVHRFDVQGQVATSSHAGIPWLAYLRDMMPSRLHFWPYDGWTPPPGRSVLVEVYPSLVRRRFVSGTRTADQHDAYAVARWMAEMDAIGQLGRYWNPPLTDQQRKQAELEGWIFGVG